MTVPNATSRVSYTGSNSTATYAYTNLKIFDDDELLVKVKLTSTLAETTLVKTTDYTVTGVGVAAGGNVVLVDNDQAWLDASGFLLSTYTLTIDRVVPLTQETSITSQGNYRPELHEKQFDRLVMIDLQQQKEINQSLKLPSTETGSASSTTIPNATTRANGVLAFDSSGNPTVTSFVTAANSAPVSSAFVTIGTDATLTNERALTGTANQVIVTDGGAGGNVVLSTPQSINTTSSVTFANTTVSALTSGRVPIAGTAGLLEDDASLLYNKTTNILTAGDAVVVTPAAAPGVLANGQRWTDSTRIAPSYRTGGMTEYGVRVIYMQTTNVTVANTGSETTLLTTPVFGTATVASAYLSAGKALRCTVIGQIGTTGSPDLTISFKYAGTALTAVNPNAAANGIVFMLTFVVTVNTAGASGAVDAFGHFAGTLTAGASPLTVVRGAAVSPIDITGGSALDLSALWGTASASNTITVNSVMIEAIG